MATTDKTSNALQEEEAIPATDDTIGDGDSESKMAKADDAVNCKIAALTYDVMIKKLGALHDALEPEEDPDSGDSVKAKLSKFGNAFDCVIRDIQRVVDLESLDDKSKDSLMEMILKLVDLIKRGSRMTILKMFESTETLKIFRTLQMIYGYYIHQLSRYVMPLVDDIEYFENGIWYCRLMGDFNRYLAEYEEPRAFDMNHTMLVTGYLRTESRIIFPKDIENLLIDFVDIIYKDRAREWYQKGMDKVKESEGKYPKRHLYPVRLNLENSFSVYYASILNDYAAAIDFAQTACQKVLNRVGEDTFIRTPYWWDYGITKFIYKQMKENIDIWEQDNVGMTE